MDFVAIDFETANEKRCSPCAIGIAVVQNGRVVKTKSWLLRPPEEFSRFSPMNVSIHGIDESMVADKPELGDIWGELSPLIENNIVCAHNASFDLSVLRNTLPLYNIPLPDCSILCSVAVARSAWPELVSYSLPVVACHLGLSIAHHDAEEDARCSAEVVLAALRQYNLSRLDEISGRMSLSPGQIRDGVYSCCSSHLPRKARRQLSFPPEECGCNPSHPLFDKAVVFTGTLKTMLREDAFALVLKAGGTPKTCVGQDVDYLVMGVQDFSKFKDGQKSSKTKRAEEIRQRGGNIEILSEADFLRMAFME